MGNRQVNVERWVEQRLAVLQPVRGWHPDAVGALARVRERDRVYRVHRRRWTWIAVAASLASLTVLSIPGRCDAPGSNSCSQPLAGRIWNQVFPKPTAPQPRPETAPAPIAAVPPVPTPTAPVTVAENQQPKPTSRTRAAASAASVQAAAVTGNFKEFGNPAAPILLEVYTDYECPACAALYRQVIPLLFAQYVQTGKVRFLHRDFPLTQHPHSRLAARYANAAGKLGQYDLVVNQLFQNQDQWGADGNIDKQVAQVLAPGVMQKVRALVENDSTLDDTVSADMEMGRRDGLNQTPTIVVVYKGKRQPIAGYHDFSLLQTYLDQLLAK